MWIYRKPKPKPLVGKWLHDYDPETGWYWVREVK